MQKFKLTVAYDGTDFSGWAYQPNKTTIASTLQDTFYKIFNQKITILGASRTDTGVHALGQIAQFHANLTIAPLVIQKAWSDILPPSIHIRYLEHASDSFNPCRQVKQKTYYYILFLKKPLPFVARFGWHYQFINFVDLDKFDRCLQLYIGEKDFASFCKVEDLKKSTIRRIDAISVKKFDRWSALLISVKGKSFLHFQIRRMIGYALDVARRKDLTVDYLQAVIDSKNPQQTLLKAKGQGLCLRKVVYHDE